MIHVDKANNRARREYLKSILQKPSLRTDRYILALKNSIKGFYKECLRFAFWLVLFFDDTDISNELERILFQLGTIPTLCNGD